ncbi:MAG: hypothetical protein R3194_11600, partial [Limnobacter sp.]|nr:hypothetical protein [Limnobacter sp.]
MSFLDTLPHLDEKGNAEGDSAWSKSFRDSLPLQGASVLVLDRSMPNTKHLKDELTLMGASQFDVATDDRGSDWIDLAADQCTMYYTSEGTLVKRFDV